MLSRFYLALVLTGIASPIFSQQKIAENMYFQKLENGLEIVLIADHTVPLTTIEVACRNGSFTETEEFNGLSHLYEHLFFSANREYQSHDHLVAKMNALDIESNGRTQEEVVNYYFTLPSKEFKAGLKLMNTCIRKPLFTLEEMRRENKVVNAEFVRQESSHMFSFINNLDKHLWGKNYSRKNVIGNHDVILTATPEKMEVIKSKYYWPNNALLIVAGDINVDEVSATIRDLFSTWKPSGFDVFKKWPIPEVEPLVQTDYFIQKSDKAFVPEIAFCWLGPDTRRDEKGTYVADVFSYLVNQNGSKLKTALIKSGLATDVSVNYYTQKYTGPIRLMVTPNPQKIKECHAEILKQLSLWDDENYLTDQQIERAKRLLSIEQVKRREITQDYAHLISFWWASASIDYYMKYEENMSKVTRQDLIDYVKKYIKNKPYVAGLYIHESLADTANPGTFFKP